MTDIYAAEFEIVVEQIDGDSQLVNFIRRTRCPIEAQQIAAAAALAAGVDRSFISPAPVEV